MWSRSPSEDRYAQHVWLVGKTERDALTLREITSHSKIGLDETTVRVPARMAHIIAEAVRGSTSLS